jgi:hypothetical protein
MTPANTTPPGLAATHIDADDAQALQQWATKFDATPDQIREAVGKVGRLAADVEMHLKGSHSTSNADQAKRADA